MTTDEYRVTLVKISIVMPGTVSINFRKVLKPKRLCQVIGNQFGVFAQENTHFWTIRLLGTCLQTELRECLKIQKTFRFKVEAYANHRKRGESHLL